MKELGILTIQNISQAVETLSGGQRQGVAVARSAAFGSRVVIMDEPTAALGRQGVEPSCELIRDVRDRGLPVILISHNMPHVFEVADRIHIQRSATAPRSAPRVAHHERGRRHHGRRGHRSPRGSLIQRGGHELVPCARRIDVSRARGTCCSARGSGDAELVAFRIEHLVVVVFAVGLLADHRRPGRDEFGDLCPDRLRSAMSWGLARNPDVDVLPILRGLGFRSP